MSNLAMSDMLSAFCSVTPNITLSVEGGDVLLPRITLREFPAKIGRSDRNAVKLSGWRIGRVHAEIHQIGPGFKLVDLGTLAGTGVNGERVVEFGPLEVGDEIHIGSWKCTVLELNGFDTTSLSAKDAFHEDSNSIRSVKIKSKSTLPVSNSPYDSHDSRPQFDGANQKNKIGFIEYSGHRTKAVSLNNVDSNAAICGIDNTDSLMSAAVTSAEPKAASIVQSVGTVLALRRKVHRLLLEELDVQRTDPQRMGDAHWRAEVTKVVARIVSGLPNIVPDIDRQELVRDVVDESVGLGPLERLMEDSDISEIMVNSSNEIYVERAGKICLTSLKFSDDAAVRHAIERIVAPIGRRIDEGSPMVDARLPDGSRVNAVIPPVAVNGPVLTIRRFRRDVLGPDDLVGLGTLSAPMLDFLKIAVNRRMSIVVSGGTGSGKTTLLNVLSNLIQPAERIITIEDAAELRLSHAHRVALEARPANAEGRGSVPIRDLVRNALRMRPDRIIVGECRGGEALDMLQAMNTGHEGSMTTVHSNTPRDVVARLEVMCLMSGIDLPVQAVREQIASAVNLIVHQARHADGRRRIVSITEVTGMEGERVQMHEIFRFHAGLQSQSMQGGFESSGIVPQCVERWLDQGLSVDSGLFEAPRSLRGRSM